MPETCQKLKKTKTTQQKTRQGETDSLIMNLTWEGGEVHHQQCTGVKRGPQGKYSATLHELANICFTTSNLESNGGSCNYRNSQHEEGCWDEVSKELSRTSIKRDLAKRNEIYVSSLSKILTFFSRHIII